MENRKVLFKQIRILLCYNRINRMSGIHLYSLVKK